MTAPAGEAPLDLVGVGIGPFNLALAALADEVPGLSALFLEQRPRFSWHPGLLLEDARLQVPFLADLVSLVAPTNRWSFLSYLRGRQRLFRFYLLERFHIPRREYDDYCRWVAESLASCRFGARVDALRWDRERDVFRLRLTGADRGPQEVLARNVVLGVGTEPVVPEPVAALRDDRVFHAAEYLERRPGLAGAADVTVVGSGQSGAEVFLDLLRAQPEAGWRLRWLTRSPAFAPMEYSKLGLEHFTPDYIRYFRGLPPGTRDGLLPAQWQLYKGISADTIAQIYDLLYERSVAGREAEATLMANVALRGARDRSGRIELECAELLQERTFSLRTDAVVLATGYAARRPALLEPMEPLLDLDERGRYRVDESYRVALDPAVRGGLFVQNAEEHTHGVGAPDLGLGAYRAAVILNAVAGADVQPLPAPSAFTSFGLP